MERQAGGTANEGVTFPNLTDFCHIQKDIVTFCGVRLWFPNGWKRKLGGGIMLVRVACSSGCFDAVFLPSEVPGWRNQSVDPAIPLTRFTRQPVEVLS